MLAPPPPLLPPPQEPLSLEELHDESLLDELSLDELSPQSITLPDIAGYDMLYLQSVDTTLLQVKYSVQCV